MIMLIIMGENHIFGILYHHVYFTFETNTFFSKNFSKKGNNLLIPSKIKYGTSRQTVFFIYISEKQISIPSIIKITI